MPLQLFLPCHQSVWMMEKHQVSGGARVIAARFPHAPWVVAGLPACWWCQRKKGALLWDQAWQREPYPSLLTLFCVAEFDKFLEERAKAAEMVPSLPSPPADTPAPASIPQAGRSQSGQGDALFAL